MVVDLYASRIQAGVCLLDQPGSATKKLEKDARNRPNQPTSVALPVFFYCKRWLLPQVVVVLLDG
jgi:hypothetical protein